MRWTPSGKSRNIEDRRSRKPAYRRGAPMGLGGIILILVVLSLRINHAMAGLTAVGATFVAKPPPAV